MVTISKIILVKKNLKPFTAILNWCWFDGRPFFLFSHQSWQAVCRNKWERWNFTIKLHTDKENFLLIENTFKCTDEVREILAVSKLDKYKTLVNHNIVNCPMPKTNHYVVSWFPTLVLKSCYSSVLGCIPSQTHLKLMAEFPHPFVTHFCRDPGMIPFRCVGECIHPKVGESQGGELGPQYSFLCSA